MMDFIPALIVVAVFFGVVGLLICIGLACGKFKG